MNVHDFESPADNKVEFPFVPARVNDDGSISHPCPVCDEERWRAIVVFQDYVVAGYLIDIECLNCQARCQAPTELDAPWS